MSPRNAAAAERQPSLADALLHLEARDWASLGATCSALLDDDAGNGRIHYLLAIARYGLDDLAGAIEAACAALAADGTAREFAELVSVLYSKAGDLGNALFHAKLAAAVPSRDDVRDWLPATLPGVAEAFRGIEETPLLRRAYVAAMDRDWDRAEHWFRQQIAIAPGRREGYLGLTHCLMIRDRVRDSAEVLRGARHKFPADAEIASQLGAALTAVGRYAEGQAVHRAAMTLAPDDATIHSRAVTDLLDDPDNDEAAMATDYRRWGESFGLAKPPRGAEPRAVAKARVTVGYLIGPLGSRRAGPAAASIIARHAPDRYRVVGFGDGRLTDPVNIGFQKAFQTWHDTRGMDPVTFATMVRSEGVDILVDLCGHLLPGLLVAFAQRLAPVQASWLGSPLGTGLACMDARLTDRHVEAGAGGASLRETPVFLEQGSILVDPPGEDPGESATAGEDRAPTFVADAALAEINPRTVELWARVLRDHPESALVLRDHAFRDASTVDELIGLFGDFGLAHRIDVVAAADAVSFFRHGDVCLLPARTLRPEVVVDALFAGRPVIALAGPGRHCRHAGSVLHHLGLGAEMVAATAGDFVALARGWAGDAARRRAFAAGAATRLGAHPFFDPAVRAVDLEAALEGLWRRASE